nr:DUF2971 domain-containing protein [Aminobacter aminovorans]
MEQSPAIIYKYVDQDGARKILGNRTLRFGRPSGMNDPFDVYIEDLFNAGIDEIHQQWVPTLLDILQKDPMRFASQVGADPKVVSWVSSLINSASSEERAALVSAISPKMLEEWDSGLSRTRSEMEQQRQGLIAQFENSGIFCATLNPNNLLMWAHYAQQHRGVVLGFRPDREKDSILALTKPVRYTDTRPTFYGPIEAMIASDAVVTFDDLTGFRDGLIYSKSTHWSYEEELRIDIPHGVPSGQPAIFLSYYPTELCEIYLGVRVDEPFRAEVVAAARGVNPDIVIFDARLEKDSYALTFERAE